MTQSIRFLLVEDNEDHAELVKQSFEAGRLANRVDHVESGEAALAHLDDAGCARPDIILLDLNLPGMSGLEVLQHVKTSAAYKTIPVVVLTTSNAERDRISAYEQHANSYVTKSVNFNSLQDIVQQLELYWTICNEPPVGVDR